MSQKFGSVVQLVRGPETVNALVVQSVQQPDGEHLTVVFLDPAKESPLLSGQNVDAAIKRDFVVPLTEGKTFGWRPAPWNMTAPEQLDEAQGEVQPTGAQRSRTLQAINTLMENDYIAVADPQTGQQVNQLPIMPEQEVEDFPTLRDTMRLFWQENGDFKKSNPGGWERTKAYYAMAVNMEAAEAAAEAQRAMEVKAVGMPPAPETEPESKPE